MGKIGKDECLRRLKLEMEFMVKQFEPLKHTIFHDIAKSEVDRLEHWIRMIQGCE